MPHFFWNSLLGFYRTTRGNGLVANGLSDPIVINVYKTSPKGMPSGVKCLSCLVYYVATLEPGPTRLADPNRNPGTPGRNHLSNTFGCGRDFNLRQAHKHLQIQKYRYYKGISSLFKMIYKIDNQSSNCFYKISIFKRKHGVNACFGAYFAVPSL